MKLYEPLSVNNIDQCVTDLKGNIIYTHGNPKKRLMSAEKNKDYWRDKVGIKAKSHFNNWVHICEQITLLIEKSYYIRESSFIFYQH